VFIQANLGQLSLAIPPWVGAVSSGEDLANDGEETATSA